MGKLKSKKTIWEVIKFCGPFSWKKIDMAERFIMLSSLMLLISYSILSMASTIILKDIVNYLVLGDMVYYYILGYCLCYFLAEASNNLKTFTFVYVEAKIQSKLAEAVFRHVLDLSMSYHLTRETGKVLRIIQRGSISVPQVLRTGLFYVFPIFLQLLLVEGYLIFFYDIFYALIIGTSVALYIVFTIITSEWRSVLQRNLNTSDSSFHSKATDALYNYETVKYCNAENQEAKRCSQAFQELRMGKVSMHKSLLVLHLGQETIVVIGNCICLSMIAYEIYYGNKELGDWILIQNFLSFVYTPLKNMGTYYETIKQAVIDSEGIIDLLEYEADVKDKLNAIDFSECKGRVEFFQVAFRYSPSLPLIVEDFSIEVPEGQTLGIVGKTGSGKSTLAKLLYRFYEPSSGKILIDGVDINDMTQESLRVNISIVPQDCSLFNDTIAYNIGYGQDCDINQIVWAAQKAQIHEFIKSLPKGYNTFVGEKGIRLSGGEKQRVAIARALLKNPKILVFDEATSALDVLTEDLIQENIKEISKNRTTLIIAHRLSSVVHADEIIVLEEGKVIESGRHEVLVRENGKYADMWKQQLSEKTQFPLI